MPSVSVQIASSPEHVWALVSDVTQMGRWSPETAAAVWRDDDGPRVGARFTGRNKRKAGWSTTCTITACEPGRRFSFEVGKGETAWDYRIVPVPGGCSVTESFEIRKTPGVVGRLLTRMAVGVPWSEREADLLDGVQQTLVRLKVAAEQGS